MPSITLTESAKLCQDELIAGVVETIVTTDRLFERLPFDELEGNSHTWNKESVLGDVQVLGVGGTITAKNPATVEPATATLTRIIGDAEVDGLIQATRSNVNDQRTYQLASKAKAAGRQYRNMLMNGTGLSNEFPGLLAQVAAGQTLVAGTNGALYDVGVLDDLISKVKAKDGEVDFITMPEVLLNLHYAFLRKLGGASINDVITLPSGKTVPVYRGVPIFVNDSIPTNQTQGTATDCTSIAAGCFDDGSRKVGIAGLTAPGASAGIHIKTVGESQNKDESIDRIVWYCGLANYNDYALAVVKGVRTARLS
ncbi:phage major capsid protein [Corallococcus exiguus]|nr:phage major capsid protein [Corallococcus exiguus]